MAARDPRAPPYWTVQRLLASVVGRSHEAWDLFDGKLLLRGVDCLSWRFDRFLSAAFVYLLGTAADENAADKLRYDLAKPPKDHQPKAQVARNPARGVSSGRPRRRAMTLEEAQGTMAAAAQYDSSVGA